MSQRLDPFTAAPTLMESWFNLTRAVAGLEPILAELAKMRASQINGCAHCLNLHAKHARSLGETSQRIDVLAAWREAPCYTDRERAALGWTEALTRLSEGGSLDRAYGELSAQFSEAEQVELTIAINVINGWNRIMVGFGVWRDPAQVKKVA